MDERGAVVFVHPAELPAPAVEGMPPLAADFLLDTTRAAYLLVRNGIARTYPNIRFILSPHGRIRALRLSPHGRRHRGRHRAQPLDVLDDFRALYVDTALSSSPAALPTLLAFARPGHVLFGSGWPFAPAPACQYFAGGLDTGVDRDLLQAVNRGNAEVLFSRLAASPAPTPVRSIATRLLQAAQRAAARLVFKLVQPGRLSKVPKHPTRSPRKPRKTSPSAGRRWPD
ncbi:amidohydrolase family protein [Streptomyces sp. NPDC057927]